MTGRGDEDRAPGLAGEGLGLGSQAEGQPRGRPRLACQGTGAGRRDARGEVCLPRRGNNGAARFKFQISPRQMSLGKEQFLFAEAGGGWQGRALAGPSLSRERERQPEHCLEPHASTLCRALSQPSAQPRCRQQPGWGGRGARALVAGGRPHREVEACTQVTQHVSGRAKFPSQV